jgi:hypothetical protein
MVLLPQHDKALKFAWLYAGITPDDIRAVHHPDPLTRARNRAAFRRRDYRKWQLLCQRKYSPLSQPNGKLQTKAEFLRVVNGVKVTRRVLASALGISIQTLCNRYGRDVVRQVCQERPVRDKFPDLYRHERNR